jgi:hypothetical protein
MFFNGDAVSPYCRSSRCDVSGITPDCEVRSILHPPKPICQAILLINLEKTARHRRGPVGDSRRTWLSKCLV